MSYKELDAYAEANPEHERVFTGCAPAIVSGVSVTGKLDGGFKDMLSKISDAHPNSPLAEQHGRGKSIKQVQTQRAISKWRSSGG